MRGDVTWFGIVFGTTEYPMLLGYDLFLNLILISCGASPLCLLIHCYNSCLSISTPGIVKEGGGGGVLWCDVGISRTEVAVSNDLLMSVLSNPMHETILGEDKSVGVSRNGGGSMSLNGEEAWLSMKGF